MLLIPALNQMIDITATRSVAVWTHVPILVFVLLLGVALLSAVLDGYAMSTAKQRNLLHMTLFAAITAP